MEVAPTQDRLGGFSSTSTMFGGRSALKIYLQGQSTHRFSFRGKILVIPVGAKHSCHRVPFEEYGRKILNKRTVIE